jgi:hypothetical protein
LLRRQRYILLCTAFGEENAKGVQRVCECGEDKSPEPNSSLPHTHACTL